MRNNDWMKDQLVEVKRDLDSWSKSKRVVMRREVNSTDNNSSYKTSNPTPQRSTKT